MVEEHIVSVGIDSSGRLFVRPEKRTFEHIYRMAMDVRWDGTQGVLITNAPRDMSYPNWFRQIWSAVISEYGVDLRLAEETRWIDMPDDLVQTIQQDRPWQEQELVRQAEGRAEDPIKWGQEMNAPVFRPKAVEAFRAGRFCEAAELLSAIELVLTVAERHKLEIARKRCQASE